MEFWLIVLSVVAVLFLLAWRYDSGHRNHVAPDIDHRANALRAQAQGQAAQYPHDYSGGTSGGG